MSVLQGTILGKRYEIIEKIGDGGTSVIYLGRDIILNRNITIKILREQFSSDDEFIRRFNREAQAVASLSHPNVVSLYDVGHQENWHYLIMEYIEGKSLKEIIKERAPLAPNEAIYFAQQICDALSHAHDKGIIHRDIKPHNILVTPNGRIKVTDFGIARAVSAATLTYSGNIVGSVHYFSPEQAKGAVTDEKSDIYSLGVVLFEMLTGALPFDGDSPIAIAIQHIQNDPPDPSSINPSITEKVAAIVLKALSKIPAARFSSALEMRWELQQALDNQTNEIVENEADEENPTLVMPAVEMLEEEKEEAKETHRRIKKPVVWGLVGLFAVLLIFFAYHSIMGFLIVPDVQVPNVTGKPLATAKASLEKAGLITENNKVYNDSTPEGSVISQSPDPGLVVKQGRMVTLLVSLGAKLVEVPDLVKKSRQDAETELQNAGFVVHADEQFTDKMDEGMVFDQSPIAGAKAPEGSIVSIKVSKGNKPQYVTMPDLKGMSLDEAKKQLTSVGLKLGVISKKASNELFPFEIISQDVQPFASIQQGSAVNLVLSEGPGPTSQSAHVSIPLPNDSAEHHVKIVVIDSKGTHEEYNATNQPGEILEKDVPYFGKGKIQVFIDDVLSVEQPVE